MQGEGSVGCGLDAPNWITPFVQSWAAAFMSGVWVVEWWKNALLRAHLWFLASPSYAPARDRVWGVHTVFRRILEYGVLQYLVLACQWAGSMPQPRKSAFEPEYRQIIARLVERRAELGMTQVEMAALYGERQSFISAVERLQRRLDVWEFVRFCAILKLNPQGILGPLYSKERR